MKRNIKSFIKISVLIMLVAAIALSVLSCTQDKTDKSVTEKSITVTVVTKDGTSTDHTVKTSADNLADSIIEAGFASGEEGQYGFYFTTVDGVVADYSVDSSYWAFSKDGEYLMTGASSTPITDGDHFEITYTSDK